MHSCKIIWLGIFWLEIVCEAAGRVARSAVAEVRGSWTAGRGVYT